MYCMNCGTKLSENAKFCPECGTATGASAGASNPAPASPAAPKKAKKTGFGKKLLILLLIIAVIAILLVVTYFVCLKIVNGAELKLPDPSTYFGIEYSDVDRDDYSDSYYYYTTEDPRPMLNGYVKLLEREYTMDIDYEGQYLNNNAASYFYSLEQEYPSALAEIMDDISAEVRLPEITIIYYGINDSGYHETKISVYGNIEFIPAEVYSK